MRRTAGTTGRPTTAEEVVRAYFERFGARDADGIAQLFGRHAAFMPNGGATVRGRDAIRQYFASVFARAHVRFDEVVVDRAVEIGDVAVLETRTSETITVHEPARTIVEEFRELFVLRQARDTWLIDSYMGNALGR